MTRPVESVGCQECTDLGLYGSRSSHVRGKRTRRAGSLRRACSVFRTHPWPALNTMPASARTSLT